MYVRTTLLAFISLYLLTTWSITYLFNQFYKYLSRDLFWYIVFVANIKNVAVNDSEGSPGEVFMRVLYYTKIFKA